MRSTILTLIYLSLFILIAGCNNDNGPNNNRVSTQTPETTPESAPKHSTYTTNNTPKQPTPTPPPITIPEASPTKISNESTRAKVVEVLEGNLIKVLTNGDVSLTIKYIGVDVPTEPIDINLAAREMNKFLVQDKIVLIEQDKAFPDNENEIKLRHVFVQGEYVNIKLLSSGLARMPDNLNPSAHKDKLTKASEEAKNLNLGLWRTTAGKENDKNPDTSSYPKLGCGTLPCPKK